MAKEVGTSAGPGVPGPAGSGRAQDERSAAADHRDQAADRRDVAPARRGRAEGSDGGPAGADRTQSAIDRFLSGRDRDRAAGQRADRDAAELERATDDVLR